MAHIEVVLLLRVLIWMFCPYVVPPLEVLHEPLMELSLGYAPSEMVSLVGGGVLDEYLFELTECRCLLVS